MLRDLIERLGALLRRRGGHDRRQSAAPADGLCVAKWASVPEIRVCLPQILSGAGGGRRITGCKSGVRAIFSGNIENHEKSTLPIANKGVLSCGEARIGTPVPGLESRLALLRSGCASFVAVMKSANLRYRHNGSERRRLHGPWFRRVFSQ